MPRRTDIQSILIIGSGPIVIGQACEFDYSGTQAIKTLAQDGYRVILVNSNPATIMTDPQFSDRTYVEALDVATVSKILRAERPDAILPTMGGQTGLNLATELVESGIVAELGIELIGADYRAIKRAEDREEFKQVALGCGVEVPRSGIARSVADARRIRAEIGVPCVIRPAFTLGGTGSSIAETEDDYLLKCEAGLDASPIREILIEEYLANWKEFELEVVRDRADNCVVVCSIENVDPMGVHTGDSVTVAPGQTVTDREYQRMRNAAFAIMRGVGVESGGANIQFAVHPGSGRMVAIEMNPRVSRSSALASKATGFAIAKVATKLAVGYTLDEIPNDITGRTYACFEPAIDYCVVKAPKFAFHKFPEADERLTSQMKSVGEVMAIGRTFKEALQKAIAGLEIRSDGLGLDGQDRCAAGTPPARAEIERYLRIPTPQRLFYVRYALKAEMPVAEIHALSGIDPWFIEQMAELVQFEGRLAAHGRLEDVPRELLLEAKQLGYSDAQLASLWTCGGERCTAAGVRRHRRAAGIEAVFKVVDTCAAEFEAATPYFYSTYDREDESRPSGRRKVMILGGGPNRIGQGIEFDYCSVHCVWTLKELGYEAVICNNNPETVSTDFDTGDRLYFDPLTKEDVQSIIETEQPYGVVVQFGEQTAIKLTRYLSDMGVRILGTSADMIDAAEDRERFDEVLEKCGIPRPAGHTVMNTEEALVAANDLGYPVLLRPSYVLGGQNMIIAHSDADVKEYMGIIMSHNIENPVLIDKYMMGTEVEVDAICDGEDFLIPGIMEHIERAGVHSGDSISIYPAQHLSDRIKRIIVEYTRLLAKELNVIGLVNIQYVVYNHEVFVIEVNPRSSRTVPYISKVTGIPMVDIATKIMFGAKLKDMGYESGLYPAGDYVAVKVPVFSFEKLTDVDTMLGPEMKSTGECLGIGRNLEDALLKGLIAAGFDLKREGGVLISVRDSDKREILPIADKFEQMGFELYATSGTQSVLHRNMIAANLVRKISDGEPNVETLLDSGKIHYVISTSAKGRLPERDSVKMRRKSIERSICSLTAVDTAKSLVKVLESGRTINDVELVDITKI